MAARSPRRDEKQALIERIESSRNQLSGDVVALAASVDVPSRIRKSIADNPLKLAAGATLAGLAGAALFNRPSGGARRKGLALGLISPIAGFAIDLVRQKFAKPAPQPTQTATRRPLTERLAKAVWEALK